MIVRLGKIQENLIGGGGGGIHPSPLYARELNHCINTYFEGKRFVVEKSWILNRTDQSAAAWFE